MNKDSKAEATDPVPRAVTIARASTRNWLADSRFLSFLIIKWIWNFKSHHGKAETKTVGESTRRTHFTSNSGSHLESCSFTEFTMIFFSIFPIWGNNLKSLSMHKNTIKQNENEPPNVVDYTEIVGIRWIDKHGNQWIIDSEGVPKPQNIENVHNDKPQNENLKKVKVDSPHSLSVSIWYSETDDVCTFRFRTKTPTTSTIRARRR